MPDRQDLRCRVRIARKSERREMTAYCLLPLGLLRLLTSLQQLRHQLASPP